MTGVRKRVSCISLWLFSGLSPPCKMSMLKDWGLQNTTSTAAKDLDYGASGYAKWDKKGDWSQSPARCFRQTGCPAICKVIVMENTAGWPWSTTVLPWDPKMVLEPVSGHNCRSWTPDLSSNLVVLKCKWTDNRPVRLSILTEVKKKKKNWHLSHYTWMRVLHRNEVMTFINQ